MSDRDWRKMGEPVREWTRKAMARILPDDDTTDLSKPTAPSGDWLVDCGVYAYGRRIAGEVDYRTAMETAAKADGFVWLGVRDPSDQVLTEIGELFKLDELALDQALGDGPHRPKIEHYGDVTVFVLRTTRYLEHPELTETSEVVETGQVLVFVGDRFVITIRQGAPGELASVRAGLEARPDRLALGPWSVAHAVCDRLVRNYLDVSHGLEADIELVEEEVFARATSDRIAHIYQLKRELVEFKRAVAPLQRPMAAVIDDRTWLPKEVRRYFRDVNDTLTRVIERIATYDDLINSLLQARLAQVSVTQNNDMRKIAAWAAIAAAQTAIAGIYGMNFDNMPELHWRYGYAGVWVIMVVIAFAMYRGFRRSGWL